MVHVIRSIQTSQPHPLGYIIENMPVVSTSHIRTLESIHRIHGIFGIPILLDAATMDS